MKRLNNTKELIEFVTKNKILIYGAGNVGRLLVKFLSLNECEDNIIGVAVSDVAGNPKEIMDVPVLRYDEIEKEYDEVIIAVAERNADDIMKNIMSAERAGIAQVTDKLISRIRNKIASNELVQRVNQIEVALEKLIPNQELHFAVHLCEHCNLNCAGCNNFSPLAKEEYTDINVFKKDMKRLSELSGGVVHRLSLTGGEPLLNPRAIEYAVIAREAFPKGRIDFITNGLLLKQQSDEFFNKCVEYDIDIDFSAYPIGLDYKALREFLRKKGIEGKYYSNEEIKTMRKEVFDLKTDTTKPMSNHNWLNCYMANNCILLVNGKLACTKIACAPHFISYFKEETKRMHITERDYIDIYKVESIDEIFQFFAKPFPFCKYCNVDGMLWGQEWKKSTRDISEWV